MEINYQRLFSSKNCPSIAVSRKNIWGCKSPITYTHLTSALPQKNTRTPYNPLRTNFLNIYVSNSKHIYLLKLKYKNLCINTLKYAKRSMYKV
jgi:hypothetical protein